MVCVCLNLLFVFSFEVYHHPNAEIYIWSQTLTPKEFFRQIDNHYKIFDEHTTRTNAQNEKQQNQDLLYTIIVRNYDVQKEFLIHENLPIAAKNAFLDIPKYFTLNMNSHSHW